MKASQPHAILRRADLATDPTDQFARWYREAAAVETGDPDAMALATADRSGRPSARMVLLKSFGPSGFRFFTNFGSRKGRELEQNPHAALLFFWHVSGRQVRIEGICRRLPDPESDAYFASRPPGSQLGAYASRQSRVLPERETLETAFKSAEARFAGQTVPRPPDWGGFLLEPLSFEFWQTGENRLHDRFRYERTGHTWRIDRLAP